MLAEIRGPITATFLLCFSLINFSISLTADRTITCPGSDESAPIPISMILINDFEDGSFGSWYDGSPASNVFWAIESHDTFFGSLVPFPTCGSKYLRISRNPNLSLSGLAVLRSKPILASPGEEIHFKFWIRSRRPVGNNLELAMIDGRNETVLIELSRFSSPSNFEWRTVSVQIPVTSPTVIELAFYGYLGFHDEDGIAIDSIAIKPSFDDPPTTDLLISTTTQTSTETYQPSPFTTPTPYDGCNATYSMNLRGGNVIYYPDRTNMFGIDSTVECLYFIDVESSRVNLTFFNIPTAVYNFSLEVYDGWTKNTSQILYRIDVTSVWNASTPFTVVANGPQLIVRFASYGSYYDYLPGFYASYDRANSEFNCDGFFNAPNGGVITSPNWPLSPIHKLDCRYSIHVPYGYRANLTFTSFLWGPRPLNPHFAFIEVYDGMSVSNETLLLRINGTDGNGRMPGPVLSSGSDMVLKFATDGGYFAETRNLGFEAVYNKTAVNIQEITNISITNSSVTCGGDYEGINGSISSPNYPGNYNLDNLDCRYLIKVSNGSGIRLTFTVFGTEQCCDYVEIYEGPELNIEKRLARLSGPNIPQDVTVGSNETLVRFFTDGSVNFFPGFYATFTEIN